LEIRKDALRERLGASDETVRIAGRDIDITSVNLARPQEGRILGIPCTRDILNQSWSLPTVTSAEEEQTSRNSAATER
jgi:hypothetical protein